VPVVSQVVPEVTRLVSRGDGVHRLTMRLQPEGLGDVRVTLTVRDGEVDVRLAAGDDARRALLEGAPELRRVLELAGATEARVLVRDLGGSTTPGGQQAWSQPGHQAGNQPGHQDSSTGTHGTGSGDASGRGEGGEQDQHARTRGGAAARDGLTDGATTLRPDPAGRAPRGVDLTM
jgi:flagellar hook-length control protein FliK